MDYPSIVNGWVIRGTKELPRLYHLNTNKTIKLNKDILQYIIDCDGRSNLKQICNKYNVDIDTAKKFYNQFVSAGAITFLNKYSEHQVDVKLGDKEPWLKEVHIDITNNCNLRCRHCFWGDNLSFEKNIPFDKWNTFLDSLSEMGVGRVVFSGGEAFTNSYLAEIVKQCFAKKIMVASIFTNGTIWNGNVENVISFLIDNRMETAFYVSLDGRSAEQHDFIRGQGNYKKTVDFIKKLIYIKNKENASYKVLINSLIHKKNCTQLIKWYDFLKGLGVDGWRFTTGRVSGFLKENMEEIKVSSSECIDEYVELVKYAIDKYKRDDDIYINVENFFNTRYLRNKKVYLFNDELCICDYKSHACSVDPHGNVQFCTGWQNRKYGNVFENNISEIWYSEQFQEMKNFKIGEILECQECKYLKYCGGGCRLECKDIYSKDKAVCKSFELFDKYIVPILIKEGVEFVFE